MQKEKSNKKAVCKQHFDEVDTDHDGLVTMAELREAAFLSGCNPTDKELKEQFMDKMDTDGDGKLSFKEFWNYTKNAPDSKEELRNAFEYYDENNDGKISLDELKAMLMQDDEFDEDEVEETLREFDIDGDNKLNYDEFVEMLTETFDMD